MSALLGAALALSALPAAATVFEYGPFVYDDTVPDVLTFRGEIDDDVVYPFRKALREHPGIKALFLDSPGGAVYGGLELSAVIRDRGLATVIPPESMCASACSFLFVAGVERAAYGPLGVHRFASADGEEGVNEGEAQQVTADIIDFLKEYDIPLIFMVRMLETPNEDMYWFPQDELVKEGMVTSVDYSAQVSRWAGLPAQLAAAEAAQEEGTEEAAPEETGEAEEGDAVEVLPEKSKNPFAPSSAAPSSDSPAEDSAAPAGGINPFAPRPAADPSNPFGSRSVARPAEGGSVIDCADPASPTEATICREANLTDLDARLAGVYEAELAGLKGAALARARNAQRAWLKERDDCGRNPRCIARAYETRLEELGG